MIIALCLYFARALATAKVEDDQWYHADYRVGEVGDHYLEYRVRDIVAIIAAAIGGYVHLGILSDQSRRIPGCYYLDPYHMLQLLLPTPRECPDLEFIENEIPVLLYCE